MEIFFFFPSQVFQEFLSSNFEVGSISLETFKVTLGRALSNVIQRKMSLIMAGELDQMIFKCTFRPKQFYDSLRFCYISFIQFFFFLIRIIKMNQILTSVLFSPTVWGIYVGAVRSQLGSAGKRCTTVAGSTG